MALGTRTKSHKKEPANALAYYTVLDRGGIVLGRLAVINFRLFVSTVCSCLLHVRLCKAWKCQPGGKTQSTPEAIQDPPLKRQGANDNTHTTRGLLSSSLCTEEEQDRQRQRESVFSYLTATESRAATENGKDKDCLAAVNESQCFVPSMSFYFPLFLPGAACYDTLHSFTTGWGCIPGPVSSPRLGKDPKPDASREGCGLRAREGFALPSPEEEEEF